MRGKKIVTSRIKGSNSTYRISNPLENAVTTGLWAKTGQFPLNKVNSVPRVYNETGRAKIAVYSGEGRGGEESGFFHSLLKADDNECLSCQKRVYICSNGETSDGKAAIIPASESLQKVVSHEKEHLIKARRRANEEGMRVLSQEIQVRTSECPACGQTYVSGGKAVTQMMASQPTSSVVRTSVPSQELKRGRKILTYHPSYGRENPRMEGRYLNLTI